MTRRTTDLLTGLAFPEGPRWHDGKLWFSDMHDKTVRTVDATGHSEIIVEVPGHPSGLGWLPDGRLLVVSMRDRRLLRLDPDGLHEVADLGDLASYYCNDMVVDALGRAYVGNFGFDLHGEQERKKAEIIMVTPDGEARVVAEDLDFPNGTVITPDGRTLIVGETLGKRLTAFDIEPDGSLCGRRTWAEFEKILPDGAVSDRIPLATQSFACMLGGPDGRTLHVCTAESSVPEESRQKRTGRIEIVRVEIPRAGLP